MASYSGQMQIEGKVALITGASAGIGACCVESLRRRGARLALTARDEGALRRVAGGDGLVIPGDLTDAAARRRMVEQTLTHFGAIDILINNAGAGLYAPSWSAPPDSVRAMFELNFFAALDLIQLVVPHMRRRRSGTIVNVGSIGGQVALPWLTLYSASKFAIGALTDGLRTELRRDGIHAMTVCPGYVRTEFQSHALFGSPPRPVRETKSFTISPQQCAEALVRGIERGARTVVTPASGWALVFAARLFPGLVERRLEKMLWERAA
jgi:short-subunit dehydrogenase